MKTPKFLYSLLAIAVFVLCFYGKYPGINIAIYAIVCLALLIIEKSAFLKPLTTKIVVAGYVVFSFMYACYGSPFTLFLTIASYFLMFGMHSNKEIKNVLYAGLNVLPNYFSSWTHFFESFRQRKRIKKLHKLLPLIRIVFIPLIIIIVFIAFYSAGSAEFAAVIKKFSDGISNLFIQFWKSVDLKLISITILGIVFSVLHALKLTATSLSVKDAQSVDELKREKRHRKRYFKLLDLKYEFKSATFLFIVLNIMLGLVLFYEVKNSWIGFEWTGQLMKDQLHYGTYILIVSILVSIAITVYYFRENLNFYSRNKVLKVLTYIWVGLNILLVLSVAIRTQHYIEHFALAHKRIGVLFFLVLCLVGLFTLYLKVSKHKTIYFLTRVNALACYVGLVMLSLINWDVAIAKYNISHYKTAFVHLDYLANLSNNALPYLLLSEEQIKEMEDKQVEVIPFVSRDYYKEVGFKEKIDLRIHQFMKEYEDQHWLEKNFAEIKAYNELKTLEEIETESLGYSVP